MASLPSVLVISVNTATTPERYLSFSGPNRILRFGPDEGVFSAHAKFAIEPAGNDLFHIRSCFNNHYWVRDVESEPSLSVSATMPQGDSTRERCTLFKATVRGGVEVQFEHVSSGLKVVMQPAYSRSPYVVGVREYNGNLVWVHQLRIPYQISQVCDVRQWAKSKVYQCRPK